MALATVRSTQPSPRSSITRTRPWLGLLRLALRLELRGALIVMASLAAYVLIEVQGYLRTYPDAASRGHLASLDSPAVRMLQGVPYRVETVGGYVVWDGGWVMAIVVGLWAALTATRLLRGEEEAGRSELVLSGPRQEIWVTSVMVAAVFAAVCLIGLAVGITLWLCGPSAAGSILFGAAIAGFGTTMAGVGAVTSQLFSTRRRAAGTASLVFGVWYLLRMVANSAEDRSWIAWTTPFGWMDRLHTFGDNRWPWLLPFAATSLIAALLAVLLRKRRDNGVGMIAEAERREPQLRFLGSSIGFAWRSTQGAWLAWIGGLGVYSFVLGTLVKTVVEFLTQDPQYRKTLEALGWDSAASAQGFVSVMAVTLGVAFSLYACWRVGAARGEEAARRIDIVLAAPVSRTRWLGGHVAIAAVASTVLVAFCGGMLWAGAWATGAEVGLLDALASAVNTLPVVALFGGLAVLVLAVLPRVTVALSASLVVVAYVLNLLGPTLSWPDWVVNLSPFAHLAFVPVQDWDAAGASTMTAIGAIAATTGLWLFDRRDIVDA